MQAIDLLRQEIKNYSPESKELELSPRFALNRQFNFYFQLEAESPYLIYLNWDGDGIIFTIKCLVFRDAPTLDRLKLAYTEVGSSTFNEGQPQTTITFGFQDHQRLYIHEIKGEIAAHIQGQEIALESLLHHLYPQTEKMA